MDGYRLLFWKVGPNVRLSPAEIGRELTWGEEVEGLIDLPVKEIVDRIKAVFPQHEEKPGLLVVRGPAGSFEATWTWQHIQIECSDLGVSERQRLIEVMEGFGCTSFDPQVEVD
jgi:hypothetical protein